MIMRQKNVEVTTLQILHSYFHTLLIAETGEFHNLSTEFILSDHILHSRYLSDLEYLDITKRNVTLIAIGA